MNRVLQVALAGVLSVAAATVSAQTYTEVTPGASAVTASTSDGNVPGNAVDGSLTTRWSASGDGAWLQLDLGTTRTVGYVKVALYSGDTRQSRFDLQVATSSGVWSTVWSGSSSGTTTALQTFDFTDASARWVRYLGHGNSVNAWNSVTEIEVYAASSTATPTPTPTPPPSATSTPTPTPTPVLTGCSTRFDTAAPPSQWVYYNSSGKLAYRTIDSRGDRIMDFSHAGYKGGGVALPAAPVKVTLSATSSGDDTSRIQAAINQVAAMAADANGLRGAVKLSAGTYRVSGTLSITTSGVVLRGAGSGTSGTVINLTGTANKAIGVTGSGTWSPSGAVAITSSYVPSGGRSFTVSSASGFAAGDNVIIERAVTSQWVALMGMDDLVRSGAAQTWLGTTTRIKSDRRIASISGNQITLDVPLSDSFDLTYTSGSTMAKYTFAGRISQVGVEGLRVIAPPGSPDNPPGYKLLSMDAVIDGWVKDVYGQDVRNGASVADTSKRITFDQLTLNHTYASNTGAAPGDFGLSGTQTLLLRCKSLNAKGAFYALTQSTDVGPIVLLDFEAGGGTAIQPHQRWATGMLVDRASLTSGAIEYMNRGNLGSGHGWTMGWGVSWNSVASSFTIQQPPGSQNWAVGNKGNITDRAEYGGDAALLPRGAFESHGTFVDPGSLYLAQLCDRLGPQALTSIGY